MHQFRTSLAVLTFALFAGAGAAYALPGAVIVDDDSGLVLAQDEGKAVEGEEGKSGETPATGEEDAGGSSTGGAMAPAPEAKPASPDNTMEEKGLQEEGR
jgi:hypothetical protein